MKKNNLSLICSILFWQAAAHADVLFLDLNMSSKEIEAARRGAQARGEKLVVIPLVNDQARKTIESAQAKVYVHSGFLATRCGQDASGHTDISRVSPTLQKKCEEAVQKEGVLKQELEKLKKQHLKPLDQDMMTAELKKLKDQGVNLTSMVVSGHNGHGSFSGVNGHFEYSQIEEAFKNAGTVGQNIRSLALWGCDSATPGVALYQWKSILPNIEIIAGYDGIAPSNERKAGHDYLQDFLTQEKKLTEIKDQSALKAAFKKLEGVNVVTASLCTPSHFVSHKESINLTDRLNKCLGPDGLAKLKKMKCLTEKGSACDLSTQQAVKKEVEQLYDLAGRIEKCNDEKIDPKNYMSSLVTRSQLQTLGEFDTVMANFKNNHPAELAQLEKMIQKVDPNNEYKINLQNMKDWPSYIETHEKLKKLLADRSGPTEDMYSGFSIDDPNFGELSLLRTYLSNSHSHFSNLDTPASYTVPNSSEKLNSFSFLREEEMFKRVQQYESMAARAKARGIWSSLTAEKEEAEFDRYNTAPGNYRTRRAEMDRAVQAIRAEARPQATQRLQEMIQKEQQGLNRSGVIESYQAYLAEISR